MARTGRPKGIHTPHKATKEREMLAARLQAQLASRKETQPGRKMAWEVLDDLMHLALGLAGYYQPVSKMQPQPTDREPNEDKFLVYANMAKDCAKDLANYQTPKMKSVIMSIEPPVGGHAAPPAGAEQHQSQIMSAQDAYRALRDGDMIDVTPNKAPIAAPAAKKRGAA